MSADIVVPTLGELVTEATIARWLKQPGEAVAMDEPLVELETDKVTVEVPAPQAGVLADLQFDEGDNVEVGALLGRVEEGDGATAPKAARSAKSEVKAKAGAEAKSTPRPMPRQAPAPKRRPGRVRLLRPRPPVTARCAQPARRPGKRPPNRACRRMQSRRPAGVAAPPRRTWLPLHLGAHLPPILPLNSASGAKPAAPAQARAESGPNRGEERVRMSRLRKRVAERLKEAQNTAAMLTTFNEADMTEVLAIRKEFQESFEKRHGVRLGFMSFFVKAAISALREVPAVNAEIDGEEIVYKNYYDIGVAVGTPSGLVVPVIRNAESMTFAEVEKTIGDFGLRARDGKLKLDELTGGTFTISNGGVYGSLNSTPILNPPQSGILGMHKIQQRPMVMPDGSIEARPMMYLALSYDHRIVDGSEAVTALVRIKDGIEDPRRLLFDM